MVWPMYGYAFAKLAKAHGDTKLPWLRHLREDVKVFTRQAVKWMKANP